MHDRDLDCCVSGRPYGVYGYIKLGKISVGALANDDLTSSTVDIPSGY